MLFTIDEATFRLGGLALAGPAAALAQAVFAGAMAALFWGASRLLKFVVLPRLIARTKGTRLRALHILLKGFSSAISMFLWVTGLYIGLSALPWAAGVSAGVRAGLLLAYRIAAMILAARGLWGAAPLCDLLLGRAVQRGDLAANKTLHMVLVKTYQVLVLAFCIITVLDELGYPVTGLITGVGLAGLTVSLAAQSTASNLFSGLMILLEHPFGIGDWIKVGEVEGTVEDLTFRSTKLRALDNSLYVLPNSSVCSATINNGTNRTKRLYRFTLGVTYDTPRATIERLMADIEAMLKARSEIEADSVFARLSAFSGSSIDILINAYVKTADIQQFLVIQNELNLSLIDVMQRDGAEFAFPSTSVYVEKMPAKT
jgi:MscS family membrane protein